MPGWLTSRLAGAIGVPLAAILAIALIVIVLQKNAVIGELRDDKTNLTTERDAARRDLVTCRDNRVTLQEALGRQNAAIAALQTDGARRIAQLDQVAADARRASASADARARSILNRPGTGNPCADADALILESIHE